MKKLFLTFLCLSFMTGCIYAKSVDVDYNDGIYHIILDGNKAGRKLEFVVSDELITNKEAHHKARAILTVNAGFFDPKNGKTVSYIVYDGETVADPLLNESLFSDKFLNRNLDKILNRSEFRVLRCGNHYNYEIAPHKEPVDSNCSIVTSAQGGPLILPELRLEEELFVVKDNDGNIVRESCSVLHKVARTVIGLKDGNIHILIITDKHPMDLYEVQELCKALGLETALNFDGGSSTSMDYKDKIEVVSTVGDGGGRRLKSFLIFKN